MAASNGNFLAGALKELGWSYTKLIAELRREGAIDGIPLLHHPMAHGLCLAPVSLCIGR